MPGPDNFYAELFRIGSRGGGAFPRPGDLFEHIVEIICRAVLKPGDLALDGGAHVGRHTWPMAERVGGSGRVLAVEAHPRLARDLVRRVRKRHLPQVEVIPMALYNVPGRVRFQCVKEHPAYSGIEKRRYDFPERVKQTEVEATTIDALVPAGAPQPFRFCKLDLEGGEFRALEGGRRALESHAPFIVFENDQDNSARDYGYSRDDWFGFFAATGFELFTLWGNHFHPNQWGRRDIPWYFLAVRPGSRDAKFTTEELPGILAKFA
jgi:FkbM family methyltransferase